jgi:hypothetical protein
MKVTCLAVVLLMAAAVSVSVRAADKWYVDPPTVGTGTRRRTGGEARCLPTVATSVSITKTRKRTPSPDLGGRSPNGQKFGVG